MKYVSLKESRAGSAKNGDQGKSSVSSKLTGKDLEKALKDRDLPTTGTADEKRAAVEAYDLGEPADKTDVETPATEASASPAASTTHDGGTSASSSEEG